MAFKNNAFATLWNIDKENKKVAKFSDKYADIQVTTSKKNKDGKYETDFTGKVRCFGKALETLQELQFTEKDKVKLVEVEVNNKYDPIKKQTYINYICWELEPVGDKPKQAPKVEVVGDAPELTPFDDLKGLPF